VLGGNQGHSVSVNGPTPEQYRERSNLKPDHPMIAVNHSASRRAMADKIGLGRKAGTDGTRAELWWRPWPMRAQRWQRRHARASEPPRRRRRSIWAA